MASPAVRTAPTFDGTGTRRLTTFQLIDASGDQTSVGCEFAPGVTNAQIEAVAVALQDASQASLWQITDSQLYTGDDDPDNADTEQRNSVFQGITVRMKVPATGVSQAFRVPAPVPAEMQGNQDIPLITGTPLEDLLTALVAAAPAYTIKSVRYTERREINQAIKV